MTQYASVECQRYCGIVSGQVEDVREAQVVGIEDCVVLASERSLSPSSPALDDLGSTESNAHYLKSVMGCPGPDVVTRVGLRVRSKRCNAKMGQHALTEYVSNR